MEGFYWLRHNVQRLSTEAPDPPVDATESSSPVICEGLSFSQEQWCLPPSLSFPRTTRVFQSLERNSLAPLVFCPINAEVDATLALDRCQGNTSGLWFDFFAMP